MATSDEGAGGEVRSLVACDRCCRGYPVREMVAGVPGAEYYGLLCASCAAEMRARATSWQRLQYGPWPDAARRFADYLGAFAGDDAGEPVPHHNESVVCAHCDQLVPLGSTFAVTDGRVLCERCLVTYEAAHPAWEPQRVDPPPLGPVRDLSAGSACALCGQGAPRREMTIAEGAPGLLCPTCARAYRAGLDAGLRDGHG